MILFLQLAVEFFSIGLFSVGGGMATVPFLSSLIERTGWLTLSELTSIIAISESTPGPIGVNMATYVGHFAAGIPGAILAAVFLTLPSFLIISLLVRIIEKLRFNHNFQAVFSGLRPASVGLIGAVLLSFCIATFVSTGGSLAFHWKAILLFLALSLCLHLPKVSSLPIPVFLLVSALLGVLFSL